MIALLPYEILMELKIDEIEFLIHYYRREGRRAEAELLEKVRAMKLRDYYAD